MTRKEKILKNIDLKSGTGLEIGALDKPAVTKKEADIYYADLMPTGKLIQSFKKDPNVDKGGIVNVNYAIGSGGLKEAIKDRKFNYVVASHVIEHVPDPIRWFSEIYGLLEKDGILSLAVPDKRYTFDICRNLSRPAEIIGAHLDRLTRPSSEAMYDFTTESRQDVESKSVWGTPKKDFSLNKHFWTKDEAFKKCERNLRPDSFEGCHIFVFTPYSFFEIIKRLVEHDLFDFEVINFEDTGKDDMEFFVQFQKTSKIDRKKQLASIPVLEPEKTKLDMQKEIDDLKKELDGLYKSKSWRYTKGLRKASLKMRKKEI